MRRKRPIQALKYTLFELIGITCHIFSVFSIWYNLKSVWEIPIISLFFLLVFIAQTIYGVNNTRAKEKRTAI